MRRARALAIAAALVACGDNAAPAPDAFVPDPCCALGPERANGCIGAKLPPGTCAVFVCPTFTGDACGPARSCCVASASICDC